jgi:hypothetical protein
MSAVSTVTVIVIVVSVNHPLVELASRIKQRDHVPSFSTEKLGVAGK